MNQRSFWYGFAAGAATVIGSALAGSRFRRGGASRILRLEKSIQVAAPVHDVWEAWTDLDSLASMSPAIQQVRSFGDRSRWTVNVNDLPMQWEAETTQIVPYQAIAWKSVSGPKHSGRVTFSSLGNDTVVHVQMNYAPPIRLLRRALTPFGGDLEGFIERALREFKAGLEKRSRAIPSVPDTVARGTSATRTQVMSTQRTRFGGVESTRPPEAKR